MLNIEKYKDEILEKCDDIMRNSSEGYYSQVLGRAIFEVACRYRYHKGNETIIEWAFREYKPVLSDEAKRFLKAIVQHFEEPEIYKVACYDNSGDILRVSAKNGNIKIRYDKSSELYECFKCLEYDNCYAPKELGL